MNNHLERAVKNQQTRITELLDIDQDNIVEQIL
jgi:hypothetical protein